MGRCQDGDRESLVGYLYDELDAADRARVDAHLAVCAECRAELEGMRGLRGQLATWTLPSRELGFAIVSAEEKRHVDLRRWTLPAGLAAAAVLLLAVAAGIANLDITYDGQGLSVRTGWSRTSETAGPAAAPAAVTRPVSAPGNAGTPWRDDLAALERRLKSEFASATPSAPSPVALRGRTSAAESDAEILRRVQALIEQSELRQRRELALRVAQLAREFDSQRQTDLVRIQQGLGQLEGSTAADRELLNYLVRVSQRQ
jgi:hypothetical protein